jgi:thiol-disulfide isomerase/thioredoxin
MNPKKLSLRSLRGTALGVALLLLAGLALPAPAAAQDFALQGLRGGRLVEADLVRGTTIFVVWASWSPRSRDIIARINPIAQRWGGQARVVAVSFQENRQTVDGFLAGKNLAADVFLDEDGAFSKKYSVATLPGLLIVQNGEIKYQGKLPDDPDRVISEFLR